MRSNRLSYPPFNPDYTSSVFDLSDPCASVARIPDDDVNRIGRENPVLDRNWSCRTTCPRHYAAVGGSSGLAAGVSRFSGKRDTIPVGAKDPFRLEGSNPSWRSFCMPTAIGNFFMKAIIRSPLHSMLGPDFAVITLRGRRTGREFSLPINTAAQPDGSLMVVSLRSRTWWRNLAGGAEAGLRLAGKTLRVRADIITDAGQVAAGLAEYFARNPGRAKYFDIPVSADGWPDPAQFRRVAAERVLIRLHTVG
jgi:hypothetical protein